MLNLSNIILVFTIIEISTFCVMTIYLQKSKNLNILNLKNLVLINLIYNILPSLIFIFFLNNIILNIGSSNNKYLQIVNNYNYFLIVLFLLFKIGFFPNLEWKRYLYNNLSFLEIIIFSILYFYIIQFIFVQYIWLLVDNQRLNYILMIFLIIYIFLNILYVINLKNIKEFIACTSLLTYNYILIYTL